MQPNKIVLACLCVLTYLASSAQIIQRANNNLGQGWKYAVADSGIVIGTFHGKPPVPPKAIQKERKAIMVYDTASHVQWMWKPEIGDWDSTASGGGGSINYFTNGFGTFSDTIKYPADGRLLDIPFYMPGRTITSLTTLTQNGGGFLPNWGKKGDSLHIPYSIAPLDTVIYIISGTVIDTNVLSQPTTFIANPLGTHDMALSWGNVPHNSGYVLEYSFTNTDYQPLQILNTDDTDYTHSGIPPDQVVYYRVRAVGDTTYYGSNFSFTNATTAALVTIQTPLITATVNSTTQITVNWNAITHASGYVLIYSTDGQFFSLIDTLPAGTTSYVHDSLSTGTRIWYEVQALGDGDVYGNSLYSDTASAQTYSLQAVATPSLTIDSTHITDVYMHWTNVANETGYLLQYSTDKVNWILATKTGIDTVAYIHTNLTPNTKYYYQVQALGNGTTWDNSGFDLDSGTTQKEVIPLLATPTVTATAATPNLINVSWTNVANETGYIVQRSLDNAVWTTIITLGINAVSYADNGLIASTKYYYRVQATADGVHYQNSLFGTANATTNNLTILTAPTLAAAKTGKNSIHVSWNSVLHATGYQLEYGLDGVNFTVIGTLTGTTYDHTGLTEKTKYYYRIKDLGDGTTYGNSAYSNIANATTDSTVITAQTLPTPTGFDATTASTTQINTVWNDITGEVGYVEEYSTNKTTWTAISQFAANTVSYNKTGLTPATKYYFRLYAVGNGTTTTNSDYAMDSATTTALTTLATPALTATAAPASNAVVNLTWSNVANESGYLLQYSLDKSIWTTINTLAANVTAFSHTGLSNSTKYYYRIQATGDGITYTNSGFDIDSATTAAAAASPLDSPTVSATTITAFRIDLTWSNVANETGYKVDRSTNGSTWTNLTTLAANVTSYSNTGLNPATTYFYRVQAIGDGTIYTNSKYGLANATTFDTATTSTGIVHAVMLSGGTSAVKTGAANLGVDAIRTAYDGVGANYPGYTNDWKVLYNYNPNRPGLGLPLPTDSAMFACTLDSMLQENGIKNIIGIVIVNEPNNVGYWTDNISAANYLQLLQACANVAHRRGIPVYDGGWTGPISRFEVWQDYINRGFKDSAANYEALAFPNGTSLANWRTSSNYASRIKYMDTIVAQLKNITTDAVNVHWYETVRDEDAAKTSVSEEAFIETCKYYSRVSQKPVITNEYGVNNNTTSSILVGLIDAFKKAGIKIAAEYGVGTLTNSDGSLTPLGQAYKNKIAGQ